MRQIAVHVVGNRFFIVDYKNDSLKWDGFCFQEVGCGYGGECWSPSATPFSSVEEVVKACRNHDFKVVTLVTKLRKKEEGRLWEKVQGLLQAQPVAVEH